MFATTLTRSLNLGAIGAAVLYAGLTIGAVAAPTPAAAQGDSAFYTAQLAQPAKKAVSVAGGVVWKCEGTACTGTKGNSRPVRVCRELNRELGDVTAFSTKGEVLADEDLARCNG